MSIRSGTRSTRRAARASASCSRARKGVLLDVDHGTYPFVTSSNVVAAQAAAGSGMGPAALVLRAGPRQGLHDTRRLGAVPDRACSSSTVIPTQSASCSASAAREFGTNTGRPRRCGWFDAVLVRQVVKVSGINGIALTKLDILDPLRRDQGLRRLRSRRPALRPAAGRHEPAGARQADLRDASRAGRPRPRASAPGARCRPRRSSTSSASRS